MNIVLIGMRGSGKSAVAKKLAEKLNKTYVDMDNLLTKKITMTLPELVEKHGWEMFRKKESEVANDISDVTNAVIATGGGVVLRKNNIDTLGKNGKFIFLETSIETMIKRIEKDKNRPALTDKKTLKEEIEEVWKKRKKLYQQTADITIETDDKTIDEITQEIIKRL
jgi:shikimate kinase